MTAASSYITETMPFGKTPDQVTLLEIGGAKLTYEVIEAGFKTIEPLPWDAFLNPDQSLDIHGTLKSLKPQLLWFQGKGTTTVPETLDRVVATADFQLELGGTFVYQAEIHDPVWTNPRLKNFLGEQPHSYQDIDGDRILRVGGHRGECDPGAGEGARTNEVQVASVEDQSKHDEHHGASAIHFDKSVPKHVQSALARLHQNLGHPKIDMMRHLRYAGAEEAILKACKKMRCDVCSRNQKTGSARPAVLPSLLDMNQLVSIDVFSAFDSDRVRHEFLSIIDHSTTFHLVAELEGHSGDDFCRQFTQVWGNVFGAPGTISADLESGLQVGVSKYAEFHGCKLRTSAGQAHWQQGIVERHGLWYQEILQRVIDEKSITSDDMHMAVQAVNSAKNELRRRHGFSPSQAVFGKDPRTPEELCSGVDEERFVEIISEDRRRQREVGVRAAAKMAFFRTQIDTKFRRALIQRSRVKRGGYAVGEMVCFYRIEKELGEIFSTRVARDDLERLLNLDPDDPDTYQPPESEPAVGRDPEQDISALPEDMDLDDIDWSGPENDGDNIQLDLEGGDGQDSGDQHTEGIGAKRRDDATSSAPAVARRVRQKTPGSRVHSVNMLKRCQTERALEKQLEKELPWRLIPPEEHQAFRAAEDKQYLEHIDHAALEPLSISESNRIRDEVSSDRILSSRFAYRDKNWSRRKIDPGVPWKHKARLVVAGHKDPDVQHLETDAPTIGRLTILTLFQVLASRRKNENWVAAAGDITAAFLNGDPMERELYLKQPKNGLGGLHPDQLLKVNKGIFGLPDSPRKWWKRLKRDMLKIRVQFKGQSFHFVQCPLDPCLFQLVSEESCVPVAYVGVHVDDLLVVGPSDLVEVVKSALSATFPVDDWETDNFGYIGSHVTVSDEGVHVTQESYASSRLFEIEVARGEDNLEVASIEQKIDNQSLIGALSWLSAQTRPDLQCGVSLAQQLQKNPLIEDIKFTNQLAKRAWEHRGEGIWLRPLDLGSLEYIVFHDSAWANALLDGEEGFTLSEADHMSGIMHDTPFDKKARKAKKENSRVASQLGILIALTDAKGFAAGKSTMSLLDWKSSANPRVCRSTFAAETTACSEAIEMGQYVRSFVETVLSGKLCKVETISGKKLKLAIDLAALRQAFSREAIDARIPLYWLPTDFQLADILTKPKCSKTWWETINGLEYLDRHDPQRMADLLIKTGLIDLGTRKKIGPNCRGIEMASPAREDSSDTETGGTPGPGSEEWPDDAMQGRNNRDLCRFWVWAFLTAQLHPTPGRNHKPALVLWISASMYQLIMACAVVFLLVLDSTTQVTVTTDAYWWCELVLTFVWSIEYILRLWSCNAAIVPASDLRRCGVRVKAALHPLMLVDLVSLASLVIDLQIDSNQLRGFGALRMLRVFTLLRLERDWRICNPLIQVLVKESKLLGGAVAIALTLLVCVSVIMFYVEAPENPKFGSVADCLWWGTTALTTVGYGDLYPESPMGRLVASITAFLGIGLFALPAGIITTGFRLEEERRLHRKLSVPLDDGSPAGETEFQLELLRSIQRLERKLEGLEGKLQDVHGEIQRSTREVCEMFYALLGAHKLESDVFSVLRLWEWFIALSNQDLGSADKYKGLEETARDYVAACPRYLGRTPSYIEFGEMDPDECDKDVPGPYLRVRFEESDDGIYRWRENIAEEKRPEINPDDWRRLPYDYLSGTFCSPSMKISGPGADRYRPLPNKLCAWLRGRNVQKLVSIKHSIEQTPPYYFLREEEQEETDEKGSVVMVTYLYVWYKTLQGEVYYRLARHFNAPSRHCHAENFSGSGLVEPAVDTWVSGFPGALAILNDCSSGVASIGERRPLNLNPISKPLPALIHSPRSGSKLRFSTCSCTRVPYLPRLGFEDMLAGPIPVPVRMREGHSTPPETVVQYEPLTLSEELEEEFHRLGATSNTLEILKEVEMDQMPQNAAGQIPASIRVAALRCMSHMLQAFGFAGSWFKAAFLLDRCTASNQFQLEQLPLTCVCVTRIVLKLASSLSLPLGSERCPAIHLIKEFATWMELKKNIVTTEVSDRALCLHEKEVLLALDWQVECPCVEHWSCLYFTRFGILAGREFQASIQQMQAKVLMFARAMVMCFPMTKEVSQRTLAMGLFGLSFVNDGLLPVSSFKPAGISA
eukprot:s1915_g1.t1